MWHQYLREPEYKCPECGAKMEVCDHDPEEPKNNAVECANKSCGYACHPSDAEV